LYRRQGRKKKKFARLPPSAEKSDARKHSDVGEKKEERKKGEISFLQRSKEKRYRRVLSVRSEESRKRKVDENKKKGKS